MRIHFIAVGGAAMHNLAIALYRKGYQVTGSDDEIFEPSLSRLKNHGLLPSAFGWFPDSISTEIDAVILGMHARIDNPELIKAQVLGIKIYSYPEFLYEQTREKLRVVIGGSHGKTTVTSMIMHVLKYHQIEFDYMVGAQVEGFDTMVCLSETARLAIFEGDEYLTSPIDPRPKFHLYRPQIAVLTGIAWDHINVFPTFENYVMQFEKFVESMVAPASLIYFDGDPVLRQIAERKQDGVNFIPYRESPSRIDLNETWLITPQGDVKLEIFGKHNLQNISAAREVCLQIGLTSSQFYEAIGRFTGAARRLEILASQNGTTIYRDFAHSPSKLLATVEAVATQFPDRSLVACMELHTFSSLKKDFLPQYHNSMAAADLAIVYYDPQTLVHKRLDPITPELVASGFGRKDLLVFTDSDLLFDHLKNISWDNRNLLFMSSGNFSGKDLPGFALGTILLKNHNWDSKEDE